MMNISTLSRSFNLLSSWNKRSVTISKLGTSLFASKAVTSILNLSGKLASDVATLSSSSIGAPITASSLKISVIDLT